MNLTKAIIHVLPKHIQEQAYILSTVQELQGKQLEVVLNKFHEESYVSVDYNPELSKYIKEGYPQITVLNWNEFTILMEMPYEE